jgi:GT2 family glycosyltransferase
MSEENFDLTITTVSWNTKDLLRKCLQSIPCGAKKISYEIHVVDNASSDESTSLVKDEFSHIRLFANKENVGFAKANNQSWREAKGRYWLLLNPDTELSENSLDALVEFMDAHPKAGMATAHLIYPDGTPQHCAGPNPSLWRIFFESSRLHKLFPKSLRGKILLGIFFDYKSVVKIGWAWGTALIVRREAVEEAGALSEDFFMYGEDVEWCLRLRKHGWQIWFVPDATIIHHKEQSSAIKWNVIERKTKMLDGFYKALEIHRGKFYVKVYQFVSSVVLSFEKLIGNNSDDVQFYIDYFKRKT